MSQPPAYTISFNFTDFAASNPTTPPPGTAIDAQLAAIKATFVGVLANLAIIQRDDGALKNQIVTTDALSPAVIALFGASSTWKPRGAWVTGTAYAASDVFQSGTSTYVVALAHTSSAALATDIAAGRLVLIFDSAGATPADASVTTAKLADGAVTTSKIGFTGLDLAGSVRAATGVQAGTGGPTGLMHAKLTAGNVYITAERAALASGHAGYRWLGGAGSSDWTALVMSGAADLSFANSAAGTALTLHASAQIDAGGHLRTVGATTAPVGDGVGLSFAASIGYLSSYNFDASAWRDLKVQGLTVKITASAVDVLTANATGIDITGTASRSGVELGWLDIPQNIQSAAYTLVLADRGKHIYSANTAGQTIMVPTNAAVAFPVGTAVTLVNNGTNPITVSATGITLKQAGAGTTGNRTLSANGLATLLKVAADTWFISGVGIS